MMDKKKHDDLTFVQDKFANDGLKVPATLSEDAIRELIRTEASPGSPEHGLAKGSPEHGLAKGSPERGAAPGSSGLEAATGSSGRGATPGSSGLEVATGSPEHGATPGSLEHGRKKRRWVRPLIAAAACFAIVIALIPVMQKVLPGDSGSPAEPLTMTADANGLYQFKNYSELDQEMKALLPDESDLGVSNSDLFYQTYDAAKESIEDGEIIADEATNDEASGGDTTGSSLGDEAAGDLRAQSGDAPSIKSYASADGTDSTSNPGSSNSSDSSGSADHSRTYTQVKDIDEADIVKTDGEYIYYLSSVENQIIIAKADNGKATRVCAIGGATDESYIDDIYVKGDRLVIIGWGEHARTGKKSDDWTNTTNVMVYDISDRSTPKKQTEFTQTGDLLSSRLIGNDLCLVTNDYLYTYRKGASMPYLSYDAQTPERLPIGSISCFPETEHPSFTVVSLMDITTGKASQDTVKAKAVLGASDTIYCNGENLYITGSAGEYANDGFAAVDRGFATGELDFATDERDFANDGLWTPRTQILKVSLSGGKVKYKKTALVNGSVNNQWSMDERDGYFRVATTSVHDGEDVNNLFILDKNMEQVGSVIGFAKDEHIEAVRYIKDKAYVITYRQTDPLFIIDLSDPTAPVIEGHVKISGFSTLLVPADAEHLLGLGFSTEENEFGEATDGVKLALFDISDPSQPKVVDSKAFPNMSSPVQDDHKALLVGPVEASGGSAGSTEGDLNGAHAAYYAFPYSIMPDWDEDIIVEDAGDPDAPSYGILVFSAKSGELQVLDDLATNESVNRCIYIGDYIYGICDDDSIQGFKLK